MCNRFYIILFSILINVSVAYGADLTSHSEGKSIEIRDKTGLPFGKLKEADNGKSLLLMRKNKESLRIGFCAEDIIFNKSSPDRSHKTIVMVKNCGATVDFATHIIIESKSNKEVMAIYSGRPTVKLSWIDNNHLSIKRSELKPTEIFQELTNIQGIDIDIEVKSKREGITDRERLNFASKNFGATGLAAKMPEELLLRLAGWSQQASGLYRSEWGVWYGPKPYGDDPEGSKNIIEGIQYYKSLNSK